MKTNKELLNELNNKLEMEYEKFIAEVIKLDPIHIVGNVNELYIKEELKELYLDSDALDRYEIKALLGKNNTLDYLYNVWIDQHFEIHYEIEERIKDGISDLTTEYIDNKMINCENDDKYLIVSDTLEKLNYYNFCYHIREKYGLEGYETFSPLLVKEIIDSGGAKYLYDFFCDMKDNEQLKYLVEIHTFDNEVYNNIQERILPKLNETIKRENEKQRKQRDREER